MYIENYINNITWYILDISVIENHGQDTFQQIQNHVSACICNNSAHGSH